MDALTGRSAQPTDSQVPVSEAVPRGPAVPCVRSESLFGRSREILIEHGGSCYRLRVTHSNKLILTK